ncbi:MAG: hypothetical protein HN576_16310, partial [Bacteriovoracaceae bacterium]|nr:hypothetical protein [Bacteriovoracaceae bacterium]
MKKSSLLKKSLVVCCLLASGVATQGVYSPQFSWRGLASDDSGIISFDEAIVVGESEVLSAMSESETESVVEVSKTSEAEEVVESTESDSAKPEVIVDNIDRVSFEDMKSKVKKYIEDRDNNLKSREELTLKIEDQENSSIELQAIIDVDLKNLTIEQDLIDQRFTEISSLVYDESKLAVDITDQQQEELMALLQESSEFYSLSFIIDHQKAVDRPEVFIQDAKIKEHGEKLSSIQTSLCEQKQEVSSLVSRIETLISKKEEIIAEVEENTDEDGEANIADSVEDTIDSQNDVLATIPFPIQNFNPMSLPHPSPYTMFPSPYTMYGYGYGQGIGG